MTLQITQKEWSEWLQQPQTKLLFKVLDELIAEEEKSLGSYAYIQAKPDIDSLLRCQGICAGYLNVVNMTYENLEAHYSERAGVDGE